MVGRIAGVIWMVCIVLAAGACADDPGGGVVSVVSSLQAATIPRSATDVDLGPLRAGVLDVRATWSFESARSIESYREWVRSRLKDYQCVQDAETLVFRRRTHGDVYVLTIRPSRHGSVTRIEARFRGRPH